MNNKFQIYNLTYSYTLINTFYIFEEIGVCQDTLSNLI